MDKEIEAGGARATCPRPHSCQGRGFGALPLPALGLGVTSGWLSPTWSSWSCASRWFCPIAVVKNPPNNLWIIAAVLAPIAVVTIIIIIITAVLCRKNKNDFKPDTMINLPQRAKVHTGMERPGGLPGALPAFLPGFKTSTFRIMVASSF